MSSPPQKRRRKAQCDHHSEDDTGGESEHDFDEMNEECNGIFVLFMQLVYGIALKYSLYFIIGFDLMTPCRSSNLHSQRDHLHWQNYSIGQHGTPNS